MFVFELGLLRKQGKLTSERQERRTVLHEIRDAADDQDAQTLGTVGNFDGLGQIPAREGTQAGTECE